MILSDRDIRAKILAGEIVVTSPREDYLEQIHASSLDLRLGSYFRIYAKNSTAVLDPYHMKNAEELTSLIEIEAGKPFIVKPGEFVLGVTLERIKLPNNIVARVEGRSSLGRLGIAVHSTAGFIDAGFAGTITLEISNVNSLPIALYPEMRICQLAFQLMTSDADVPYSAKPSAKYQGQELPQVSLVGDDPEFQLPLEK